MGRAAKLGWSLSAVTLLTVPTWGAGAEDEIEIIGLNDLIDRIGEGAVPTGTLTTAGMVEAGNPGYSPNQGSVQYSGKTFYEMSGPAEEASHAHAVGQRQYGRFSSIAPDVPEIYLWSATDWVLTGFLHTGAGGATPPDPLPGPIKVMNHSWIGTFGAAGSDNDALRRADFVVNRDQLITTSGVRNDPGAAQPLMRYMYNGITVGVRNGGHVPDTTESPFDGPGRMKPDIVAQQNFTSFATPQVNAMGTLLSETAATWSGLDTNPKADDAVVIKAAILAGAVHEDVDDGVWSNDPDSSGPNRGVTSTPYDEVMGAGTANIDRSHLILTGLEQDGGTNAGPGAPLMTWRGWDATGVAIGDSRFYRFDVASLADEVSIIATWNRNIRLNNNTWTVADFDLVLWKLDGGGLTSIIGDAGLAVFGGGNVISESAVDNVEHLYLTDLAPGDYVLEVVRLDSITSTPSWEVAVAWLFPEPTFLREDVNQDGFVDFMDLLAILSAWGPCGGCAADIDGSGTVDFMDLLAVLSAWGA